MTLVLVLAAVIAQGLDALTWMTMDPRGEVNPLIQLLGPYAPLAKVPLLALVLVAVAASRRKHPAWGARIAMLAIVAGLFGAWSNS